MVGVKTTGAGAKGSDSDSDVEFDLTSSLIPQASNHVQPKNIAKTSQKQAPNASELPDGASDSDISEDENDGGDDSETEMIRQSVQAHNRKKKKSGGFQSMGLHPPLFRAIIKKGFKVPTPIQRRTIPVIMQGRDVVGMARTGSGKTAAFLIPMINRLKAHSAKVGVRAILLAPSRELALQTHKVAKELVKFTDLRAVPIVGGDSLEDQFGIIASNPDIIVATPGRLLHLVVEMSLDLSTVEYIVFDEADRLFELGFSVQLHEILARLSANRQTLLFSATLPGTLVDFAKAGLHDPELIRLDVESKVSQDLEMAFFHLKQEEKDAALIYLLKNVIRAPVDTDKSIKTRGWRQFSGSESDKKSKKKGNQEDSDKKASACQTIVFVSTKHHVEYLNALLTEAGFSVSHIYGSLDQSMRKIQISRFSSGKSNVLIVTDVAARGIDIPILENVINYDFVDSSKVFIHRVGRVARAGRRGWAYSLTTAEELPFVLDLQLFLGRPLHLGSSVYKGNGKTPNYTKEIVFGRFPLELIETEKEWVIAAVANDITIEGMQQTAVNGSKLYRKSKQMAAKESYKRAKEVQLASSFSEPHILLLDRVEPEERQRMDMLRDLSGFRPNETIFEIGKRGIKHTTTASLIMQNYRLSSGRYIENTKRARSQAADPMARFDGGDSDNDVDMASDEPSAQDRKKTNALLNPLANTSAYRDNDFYISYTKTDSNTERGYAMTTGGSFAEKAQGAILALNGDENETLLSMQHAKQSKNALRWDSKKKNFVRGNGVGADNKKLIKTESGTFLPATYKAGTFRDWQDKTKTSIPRVGEQEMMNAASKAAVGKYATGRFQHTKVTEAKPLDPLSFDYERKLNKRKQGEEGGGDDGEKYKGTVVFNDDNSSANKGGRQQPGKNAKGGNKKRKGSAGDSGKKRMPAKSELRSKDQIRKNRIIKERRIEKTGRHDKKSAGGKGRGKGKRR
ncbi:ATP-dependent RNA helicase dbp10 [Coemansia sp. RSA 1813]|nr:ATP-dependent RNA helicase dbp10 [Coemansia sp. RSA 1843]KAJ2216381.1 ATP-dependent RNA helicase dbp10 [Coemansia sp. RSA 487]KAJ2570833.1 ATP-dependent RNA helicase dbp10 [Coemansia sp. RSA 1813]